MSADPADPSPAAQAPRGAQPGAEPGIPLPPLFPPPPQAPAEPAEPPLHTKFSRGLVLLALGAAALALALGNPVLLALAGLVAALLHAARADWPGSGSVELRLGADRAQRGRTVEAALVASAGPAPCAYYLHATLPEAFALDGGSNVAIVHPGSEVAQPMRLACTRRGAHRVGPAVLVAVHPHLLAPAQPVATAPAQELVVEPRVQPLRRARSVRTRAKAHLGDDRGARGPGQDEFRELREYHRGDPLKAVNWKATAKRSAERLELMVNQHEPEARKHVWFFLDLAPHMEVGTSVANSLEDAVEVALALTHHFLLRGHRVGGTTYNGQALAFYPDGGSRQQLAIARGLAQVEPGDGAEGLEAAAERVRGFLVRERPTVFVITRADVDPDALAQGARRVQRYASGRRAQPVYALSPRPAAATEAEGFAMALRDAEAKARLGRAPVLRVLSLRDGLASLETALAKGVLTRR